MHIRPYAMLLAAAILLPEVAHARVVRLVIEQKRVFADGESFGEAGPYERLDGTAHMEVDPADPLNRLIVNLDKVPRTSAGTVEFSAPFVILKPVNMAKSNGKIWYGINNRGNVLELQQRSFDPTPPYPFTNDPLSLADVGRNLLLELGYVFVDAGWQGNARRTNNRRAPTLPVPQGADGRAIVGKARVEFQGRGFTFPLSGSAAFVPYETADTNTRQSNLTVRDGPNAVRGPIPPDEWAFGRCPSGRESLSPGTTDICLFGGFDPDRIYELIYPAANPMVMGLGYAITRDVASFLRYQTHDDTGTRNPLALDERNVGIRRAYASGTSSTGMYLRDWLYLGFNEDEDHRRVFDGVHITIPGTHRLFANVQFADPNVYSRQDMWHDFLSNSYPPHTFAITTDPVTGLRDGILRRPATDPLVFQIDTANEFWQMMASLNVVDGIGQPVPVPANVRLYYLSSFSHIGASSLLSPAGPPDSCRHATHDLRTGFRAFAPTLRALAVALDEWVDKGIEPPASNYPTLRDGTLVPLSEAAAAFPTIPGVNFPTRINELKLPDFGPGFRSVGGIPTQLPPAAGAAYSVFVPKPDADGLDIAGIRPIEMRAPIGTNVGWNTNASSARASDLCGLNGAFFPFSSTEAERASSRDPRRSLEARYESRPGFLDSIRRAARELVEERFMLEQDARAWVRAAEASDVLR